MSRSVTGPMPESADVVIAKLRKLAVKHNVEFVGDTLQGYVNGKGFHLKYVINGMQCTLTVTKKPLLVPWSLVESQLHKLFA